MKKSLPVFVEDRKECVFFREKGAKEYDGKITIEVKGCKESIKIVFFGDKASVKDDERIDGQRIWFENKSKKCKICCKKASSCCSGCRYAYYCSRNCQVKNWKEHKEICEEIKDFVFEHGKKSYEVLLFCVYPENLELRDDIGISQQ